MNVEVRNSTFKKERAQRFQTSIFEIPCSIFDILMYCELICDASINFDYCL